MNVLIVCAVGMSSGAIAEKTRACLRKMERSDIKIGFCGSSQAAGYALQADLIILAPSISYLKEELEQKEYTRVLVMPVQAYGEQNPETVVDMILNPDAYTNTEVIRSTMMQRIAEMIGTNAFLNVLRDSFASVLPITILGSIFSLLSSLPFEGINTLLQNTGIARLLNLGYDVTLGMISLYLSMQLSYIRAKQKGMNGTGVSIAALIWLFIFADVRKNNGFDLTYLGYRGIYSAILMSYLVVELFDFVQMHTKTAGDSRIPKQVSNSFRSLLPAAVCSFLAILLHTAVQNTLHTSIPAWLDLQIRRPIAEYTGTGYYSYLSITLMINFLWFFGIHGGSVVGTVMEPILSSLSYANLAAMRAGMPLPNMVVTNASQLFTFGGAGSTLPLVCLMAFRAKSQKLKSLGKLSLPMGIFFINEPVIFGLPIILNPLLFVPFLFIPLLSGFLSFTAMHLGMIPYPYGFTIPWTTPPVLWGMIQGGWRMALWQALIFVLQLVLWYPFFRFIDRQEAKKEK